MIDYIQGSIIQKSPTYVVIESGGLGYHVNISLNTFSRIQHLSECKLFAYMHISGGMQTPMIFSLYGFYDTNEREVFTSLLSISGIGASTVRVILSSMSPLDVQQAIVMGNTKLLESIKGIGPKSAQRIVLELKDKMARGIEKSQQGSALHTTKRDEAISALMMLGVSRLSADQTLNKLLKSTPEMSVEEMIKATLKAM